MAMKRALIAALIVACATAATVAEAAVSGGTFTGRTTAKDPVGITVGGGSRITGMYFENVHVKCSDNDEYNTFTGADRMEARKRRVRIKSGRKWTLTVSKHKGALTWTASGRFSSKGTRTSGTLRLQARYDIENNLDPKGQITCDSGKLKFTATRG
jgi:hypothetical protein